MRQLYGWTCAGLGGVLTATLANALWLAPGDSRSGCLTASGFAAVVLVLFVTALGEE